MTHEETQVHWQELGGKDAGVHELTKEVERLLTLGSIMVPFRKNRAKIIQNS